MIFFFAFSDRTSLDRRSFVGIFFLSTSVPEVETSFGYISRTVGPRGLVSKRMLLHLERRDECRLNHLSISFRSGCVFLESGVSVKFFQVPKEKSEKSKKSRLYESIQEVEKRTLDL